MKRFKAPGLVEHQPTLHAIPRTKRDDCLRIKVKSVCKKCNNEWMNVLQQRSRPIIEGLLDCPTCTLDIYTVQNSRPLGCDVRDGAGDNERA
jgi:hypothetical protein